MSKATSSGRKNKRVDKSGKKRKPIHQITKETIKKRKVGDDLSVVTVVVPNPPRNATEYTFNMNQLTDVQKSLNKWGFAVIRDIINPGFVTKELLLSTFKKEFMDQFNIDVDDPKTQSNKIWPLKGNGYGFAYNEFTTKCRSIPNVKKAFSFLHKTKDLVESIDNYIFWRNPSMALMKEKWTPRPAKEHVDQNPHFKSGFHCYQGMLCLSDVHKGVGGLGVVPGSNTHSIQMYLCKSYPKCTKRRGDWLMLSKREYKSKMMLVEAEAGSFVIWDARTIHGGMKREARSKLSFGIRLAMPICFMPVSKIKNPEKFWKDRRKAIENKQTLTHWANECVFHPCKTKKMKH